MKYRKKSVVIEAVQYNGSNVCEIEEFIGKELQQTIVDDCGYQADATAPVVGLIIETLEGDMVASPLDYIIKGVKGEFYPCKPDVFKQTYEDAKGEEMLMVSRKEVQERYAANERLKDAFPKSDIYLASNAINVMLQDLFGSKCLPNNVDSLEPKPAEPKYHEGNKVLYNGYVYEIEGIVGKNRYALKGLNFDLDEDMIEPYTEPILQPFSQVKETKASVETGDNLFKQHFAGTTIAVHGKTDDHFADASKMIRLNIAAMMAQGIMANSNPQMVEMNVERVVDLAILTADTLIAESEKGGNK